MLDVRMSISIIVVVVLMDEFNDYDGIVTIDYDCEWLKSN